MPYALASVNWWILIAPSYLARHPSRTQCRRSPKAAVKAPVMRMVMLSLATYPPGSPFLGESAAHPTLPMPSYVRVTNLGNGRSLLVRINDRGPFVPNRIIDLSYRAASKLGFANQGVARLRVQYAGPAPL